MDFNKFNSSNIANKSKKIYNACKSSSHFPSLVGKISYIIPKRIVIANNNNNFNNDNINNNNNKVNETLLKSI